MVLTAPAVAGEISTRLTPTFIANGGETLVASAVVTDPPYNADNTGQSDATPTIQQALDAVAARNGGLVYMPAGRYRIEGNLRLGYGTTLMGQPVGEPVRQAERAQAPGGTTGAEASRSPAAALRLTPGNLPAGRSALRSLSVTDATVLLAYAGRGDESAPPLISVPVHHETGLMNLAIWYPEQTADDIQPYPFTIAGGSTHLRNLTLCNSYNGVELRVVNASVVENVRGTVLRRGLVAAESFEFSWMHDLEFANRYWQDAARQLGERPFTRQQSTAIDRFTQDNLVGLELGRLDALAIYRYRADDAKLPILIRKNDKVNQHPVFGFGGVVGEFHGRREEHDWDPWYYGMHYANLDNVPEAKGRSYTFAPISRPRRTDSDSFLEVTDEPYSAAGDGQVDDTDAIRRALKDAGEAGGGTVHLPQGEYRVTQPLTVPPGVELRGPLGTGKIRLGRETCVLAVYGGRDTEQPESDTAAITLRNGAGVRGFSVVYPEQAYDAEALRPYPYTIRGNGKGVWVADLMLANSYHGIDLATHRCDGHVVVGVWGTVFHNGLVVGGGSRGGKLERIAFSYGPWSEAGRLGPKRTDEGKQALAEYSRQHNVHFLFGDCVGETAWGLVGFYPKVHFYFRDDGPGCRDAEFWHSMHDVADYANVLAEGGSNIHLLGYFGTGGRDKVHNWLEIGDDFKGPLHVYAKTIEQKFLNHPFGFTAAQVRFHDEVSLTAGRPATASATSPGTSPANAVDHDARTFWEAPAGSHLQVDLGSVRRINRFGIESAGLFMDGKLNTEQAELQVSLDGREFTPAGTLHARPGGKHQPHAYAWADMPLDPVEVRYVRLVITHPGADETIRVASFDVFETNSIGR